MTPADQEAQQRLFAVRGAAQASANEKAAILSATEELMHELIERNGLEPAAMVSCLFTTTEDLDAEDKPFRLESIGADPEYFSSLETAKGVAELENRLAVAEADNARLRAALPRPQRYMAQRFANSAWRPSNQTARGSVLC